MTTPTKIALGLFGGLIAIGLVVTARHPLSLPLPDSSSPSAISSSSTASSLPVLADRMPDFQGITRWWNTPDGAPLTPASLKGKVVMVDFWTYSCINCIRTYPFLKSMYQKYADKGLVIVGVHTPEFAFEANGDNVDREIKKNGLLYPIALDANYGTWNAYQNNSWPAEYVFDREGRLRDVHLGEGEYDQTEGIVRALLQEGASVTLGQAGNAGQVPNWNNIETPETYFGLARGQEFMGQTGNDGQTVAVRAVSSVDPDRWTAGGSWRWSQEYAESVADHNVFRMSVQANAFHLVLASSDGQDKHLEIFVDGQKTQDLTVNQPELYTVATFPDGKRHVVEIRIKESGVKFFSATFS